MKKAILSLSGGLDSTCLLMYLLAHDYEVKAYSFQYGQKHQVELEKVKRNIEFLQGKRFKLSHQIIDLRDCFSDSNSSLHVGGEPIPEGHYASENMKSTVIENRNVIFSAIIYGKALSWANKTESNVDVFLGLHSGDHCCYPDTSEESRIACEHAFKVSNWGSERVGYEAPFNHMDKGGVLAEGLRAMTILGFNDYEINLVLGNTHTCYNPDPEGRSCGRCGSCIEESQKVLMSDNTWKQIKDVCIGDEVWSVDENTKKICVAKVLDKFDNGIQPVYDMAGLLLTKDHYVYASNMKLRPRYRKYEEMKRKDATYMVKFWPVSNTRKEVDDEKFALGYLRGFADGDGSIDARGVHTFQKEFDVLEEFWSLYDKYIKPCDVKITYREDTNMHRAGGGYGPVFLEKTKFNEHPEYLRGYLNGMLIADGCACHNKSNGSFGFSISQAVIVNKEKCIQIDKALSLLGIKCDRSQSVTPGFKEGGTLMQTWRVTRPYIITLKYGAGKRASMLEKLGTYNSIRLLDQVVVNKIDEPVKEAHVYDIKTSAGSFICEGYLVHNCTERLEAFELNGMTDPIKYQHND
ncbi:7-cyano-7-deazaguanine synthase [Barnesiella intestinihominis]|jgi:7-cyano-7-deazaguanine synthase|uniref:7-cyano-7-deazaguanine synthase n=1 Tax=Barnesiella intestinihominis TaxID=487174 RepID=UPI003AB6DF37